MPTWKEDVASKVVPPVLAAVQATGHVVLAVDFDFANCLVRVCVPEGTPQTTANALRKAARLASPVGIDVANPPEYPFTLHLRGPVHQVRLPAQRDGVAKLELLAAELTHLRRAYREVSTECGNVDSVVTFAMGGIPGMQFVSRLVRNDYADDTAFAAAIRARQQKFHVFPGLLWTDDGRNVPIFTSWLDSLSPGTRVLVFDTSFSGGAIGRIRNAIEAWAAQQAGPVPSILLLGVLDLQRLERQLEDSAENIPTAGGVTLRLIIRFIRVPSLVTEDVTNLVGYEATRGAGAIEATWTSAVLEVRNADGALVDVRGTRTLPATFAELLDADPPVVPLTKATGVAGAAMGVLVCIRQAATTERDELVRAGAARLLDGDTLRHELKRVRAEEKGALKRYRAFFDALDDL
jgi:hypothetical protein